MDRPLPRRRYTDPHVRLIHPAAQNMLLAARALGLGATLTTLHLQFGKEVEAGRKLAARRALLRPAPDRLPDGSVRDSSQRSADRCSLLRSVRSLRSRLTSMRSAAAHLGRQLILALSQVHDMPQQAIGRPFHITDFDDHFRPHPMESAKHQR